MAQGDAGRLRWIWKGQSEVRMELSNLQRSVENERCGGRWQTGAWSHEL